MIKIEGKTLIIEVPSSSPTNDLQALQSDIINAIQCFNYSDFGGSGGSPFMMLLELLTATLPTFNEMNHLAEFKELARTNAPDSDQLKAWVTKQVAQFKTINQEQ